MKARRKPKTTRRIAFTASPVCANCGGEKHNPHGAAYCEKCAKERDREQKRKYYHNNKASIIAKREAKRKETLNFIREIKRTKRCERCGCSDYRCLTFHHIGHKEFEISEFADNHASKRKILAEIDKCIVLCANCHMIEHFVE